MNYHLNAEQLAFVTSPERNITLAAPPGSGKTLALDARIVADQDRGEEPAGQLVVTKTVAAATNMRSRFSGRVPAFIGTIHALALDILNDHGSALGYRSGDIEVIDEDESREIMNDMAKKVGADKSAAWRCVGEWNPKTAAGVAAMAHQRILRSRNQTDFPCMLAEATRIGQQYVLDYANALYVDEHQDTTYKELELLRALKARSNIVVGDEDQSIFGWDHSLAGLYSMCDHTMALKTNYRSGHFIIEAANKLASHFTHYRPEVAPMVGVQRRMAAPVRESLMDDDTNSCSYAIRLASDNISNGQSVAILCRHNYLANKIIAMAGSSLGATPDASNYLNSNERKNVHAVISEFAKAGSWSPTELRQVGLTNRERRMIEVAVHRAGGMNKRTLLALDEQDIESRRCHVGTVHSFKGREADVVYLVGFEAQRFEKNRNNDNDERKVAYVALTRAVHVFHAIHARTIWIEGKGDVTAHPSVFLKEMMS